MPVNHIRGFSLVELVIVLAIVAVFAAVAVPKYSQSLARYRADATARRVVADLDRGRAKAASSSQSWVVNIDLAKHELIIPGAGDLDTGTDDYVARLAEAPYEAKIVSANFGGGVAVTFDGFGVPDNGGSVVVKAGGEQRTITLDAQSGKASVQ